MNIRNKLLNVLSLSESKEKKAVLIKEKVSENGSFIDESSIMFILRSKKDSSQTVFNLLNAIQ